MIFDNYLGFLDEFTENVEVFNSKGEPLGHAELIIKNNLGPILKLQNYWSLPEKYENQSFFTCKSSNHIYQLFDCEHSIGTIYPDHIIRGSIKRTRFKKIEVLFQGITQWLDSSDHTKINRHEIIRTRKNSFFNVELLHENKNFKLSNKHWADTKKVAPNSQQTNQYTILVIQAEKSFSLSELSSIIHQIGTFFTLLIGHPIGVKYILDANNKNNKQSIYLPNISKETNDNFKCEDCFIKTSPLFNQNRLPTLLKKFFNSGEDYKKTWARISGALAYQGFWEYKTLAYVSLLDKYVTIGVKEGSKYPKNSFKQYKILTQQALSDLEAPNPSISNEQHNLIIDDICKQISSKVSNTIKLSFKDKFDLKKSDTNLSFLKILALTDEHFIAIKEIRDLIAHGEEATLEKNNNLKHENFFIITNKISLLLRYWSFMDIGFTHIEFLTYLKNWGYSMTREADIDNTQLDIALGYSHFLKTNKTNFVKAKKNEFRSIVLRYVERNNTYLVDTKATDRLQKWRYPHTSNNRSIEEELISFIEIKRVNNIAYVGNSYIQYDDNFLKLHNACIINCPESIISSDEQVNNRLRVFDHTSKTWLPSKFEKKFIQNTEE